MIPYETDPSLHDHEPAPARLDDGFSPPEPVGSATPPRPEHDQDHPDAAARESERQS
jgi:hypothetical protein